MKRSVLIFLLAAARLGWSQAAEPAFEVASIKPAPPRETNMSMRVGCSGGPETRDPGRWTCENATVGMLIGMAFDLKRYQLPDSRNLPEERFIVTAKIPEGATKEQLRLMQQNLLKERFKLVHHFDKKEIQGFELVVARGGVKMKEAVPPTENPNSPAAFGRLQADPEGFPILPPGVAAMAIMSGRARSQAPNSTVQQLANQLGTQLNAPVFDATGLTGKYDVDLKWATDGGPRPPAAVTDGAIPVAAEPAGPTLQNAVQEQLGLRLQPKKVTVEFFVVDRVEKTPTEN